jgi:hypothetical protein
MKREQLYHIPERTKSRPYLRWYLDPRLRRYICGLIPDDYLPFQVVKVAQDLVEEIQQLKLEFKEYQLPQQNLSGSMTALLAHILFLEQNVRLDKHHESLERHFQGTELRDLYQVSLVVMCTPGRFLANFEPEGDWYTSLCSYSHNKFRKSVSDELRVLAGGSFGRTNLGLLKRTSSEYLEIAIDRTEKRGTRFSSLKLLHVCLQDAVKAKDFVTKKPQADHYDRLLVLYRERKKEADLEIADRIQLEKVLKELSTIVRNYYQLPSWSFDLPLMKDVESGATRGDNFEDPREGRSIEYDDLKAKGWELFSQNSRSIAPKIRLADLSIFLLDGLGLTQTEVGIELGCHFSVIGRRRSSQIAKLAKALYLNYENLPPTTDVSIEIINAYKDYIDPLCEEYYLQLAIDLLAEVTESTKAAKIVDVFVDRIQSHWQFQFQPAGIGLEKVAAFVRRHS